MKLRYNIELRLETYNMNLEDIVPAVKDVLKIERMGQIEVT
jgi:hypothetical protein